MDQLETVVRATARTNIWIGAVRAGKTVASVAAWLDYLYRSPKGRIHAIVGKTSSTVQRNIVYENLRPKLGDELVERRGYVEIFGQRCEIFGANDERSVDKLMGVTLQSALCDEVTTWGERYYRMLQTRLSAPGARLYATANPAGPFHWFKKICDDPKSNHFHMTLDDNPHLDEEYVEAVKEEMRTAGPMFYGRYILGNWVAAEGQIYDFSGCVVDELPKMTDFRVVGVDIGYSNPTAFVELTLGEDGNVYVTRELYHDPDRHGKREDAQFVQMLLRWMGQPWCNVYVDPSAAGFRVSLGRAGLTPYGGARKINDVRALQVGISEVQRHFSEKNLLIYRPACGSLIRELEGYSWDEKQTEKGLDRPLPIDDHACDALRYAVKGGWKLWNMM